MSSTFLITSPSPQYTKMVQYVSKSFSFDSIVIIESILEEAVEQVLEYSNQYDIAAIISRGSTAQMIRNNIDIPVLVAEANSFDILTAFIEAMKVSSKIAYIQYEKDSNEDLTFLLDLLNIHVKKYFFITYQDMVQAIHQAASEDNKVAVCGSKEAQDLCEQLGLPSIGVNTSHNTMKEILTRAALIQNIKLRDSYHQNQLRTALNFVPDGILYLDEHNQVTLINKVCLELLDIKDESQIIGKPITDFIKNFEFIDIINGRNQDNERIIDFLGKKVVLRSAPVFVKESYIGSVISIQNSENISNLEHKVRRQIASKGMTALATFKEIADTTRSKAMRECINKAKLFANTENTILIIGESGSGKELIAQSIHNASSRRNHPFVAINCSSIPHNILESELFGYEEGAFTGAKRGGKPGYFELAHDGTLFLDELGLLPLYVQVQLLRVLQEKQVLRVGGVKLIPVNVRIIAATNENLLSSIEKGTFRLDLYYRLNELNITVPPLRARKEDIPALVKHYLTIYCAQNNKTIKSYDKDFIKALQNHDWPGNVRELMSYILRITILSKNDILTLDDIKNCEIILNHTEAQNHTETQNHTEADSKDNLICLYPDTLDSLEDKIIQWYMNYYNGNHSKVCNALKICRTTLWKKLNNHK